MRIGKPPLAIFLLGSVTLLSAGDTASKVTGEEAFEKMKTLVGSWEGTVASGIQSADFQLIANSSVIMSRLSGGMPHDMHTMFHLDGSDLMATHYCAMRNQPRFVLVSAGDANKLVFEFKDGTNIKPGEVHMNRVVFIIDGANHHVEEWTYVANGEEKTTRSDFRRKP